MQHVIIGNGIAGTRALETLRGLDEKNPVVVLSDEKYLPYSRVALPELITGELDLTALRIRSEDFYQRLNVTARLGEKVVKVAPRRREVVLAKGEAIRFDTLLIATGGEAVVPELPGADLAGVFTLRTVPDALAIAEWAGGARRVVVSGAGLVGSLAANALARLGRQVTMVARSKQILSQMLDREAARRMAAAANRQGVELHTGDDVKEILPTKRAPGKVGGVVLESGRRLPCEMVIFGKGVSPRTDFLKGSGVKTDRGVLVGERVETNVPNIYAAGDVAQATDLVFGAPTNNAIWPCAEEQGKIAGCNMAGEKRTYRGSVRWNILPLFGQCAASIGATRPLDDQCREMVFTDSRQYTKLVLRGERILGAVIVGNEKGAGALRSLIMYGHPVPEVERYFVGPRFCFPKLYADLVARRGDQMTVS